MKHTTASLMLALLITTTCYATDNIVFDIHRQVECHAVNEEHSHPGYFCRIWKERLAEEGHGAILCRPVTDPGGMRLLGCSPSWTKLHPTSSKIITATYTVAKYNNGDKYLQAIIDYPETTSGEIIMFVVAATFLITCVCCAPPPESDPDSGNFLTGVMVGSMLSSDGDHEPSFGGTDYTKDE